MGCARCFPKEVGDFMVDLLIKQPFLNISEFVFSKLGFYILVFFVEKCVLVFFIVLSCIAKGMLVSQYGMVCALWIWSGKCGTFFFLG